MSNIHFEIENEQGVTFLTRENILNPDTFNDPEVQRIDLNLNVYFKDDVANGILIKDWLLEKNSILYCKLMSEIYGGLDKLIDGSDTDAANTGMFISLAFLGLYARHEPEFLESILSLATGEDVSLESIYEASTGKHLWPWFPHSLSVTTDEYLQPLPPVEEMSGNTQVKGVAIH